MKKMTKILGLLMAAVLLLCLVQPVTGVAATGAPIPGDMNGDGAVTGDDVMLLLWHKLFPNSYPLSVKTDLDGDGSLTNEDVVLLLWNTMFPEKYPVDGTVWQFYAGFGMTDISPADPVPMSGYGDSRTRLSQGFYTPLEARCVAIRDRKGQLLLFLTADVSGAPAAQAEKVRKDLAAELGIHQDYVIISGTHTHASVDSGLTDMPAVVAFNNQYVEGMKSAARAAVADLKPAQVYVGSVQTQGMNFVRRYIMDDGSLEGDNAYGTGTVIVRHETDADPELQLMKFVRQGGKDILISQFQAHPHLEGKTNFLSAQTVGAIRDAVEDEMGIHSLHWQGASGNLNSRSRFSSENKYSTADRVQYGYDMCEYIKKVYNGLTKVRTGPIQVRATTYTGQVNHSYDNVVEQAKMVQAYFNSGHTASETATYAHQISAQYGLERRINSYYHANRIVSNSKLGNTRNMTLYAWSFGEVGGVLLPGEMFDTTGMQIKTQSPFLRTFIVGYAYPSAGSYIPTREGYANGGYESDNSIFAPGTAEGMVDAYLDMLEDMH